MENYGGNIPGRESVYRAGEGFYRPYVEPQWKIEKRKIRGAGNGIGLASLAYIAISLGAGLFSLLLIELFYPAAGIYGFSYATETLEWALSLLTYIFSLIIPFGVYALCTKMPLGVALPFKKAKVDLTVGGVFIGLGLSVIAGYATTFLQSALELVGIGITMPEMETPETLPAIIIYVIALTLAPAFIEEIVFRGIIMQNLRRFGDVFALLASSLIFGIFHLNLVQMPYAFILGLGIGYFVMRTGSLWVGVIIHFINNSVATAFEFLTPAASEEVLVLFNLVYNLFCAVAAVICLALVLTKYKNLFRFEKRFSALSSGKKVLYFLTSPALILAMIAAVIFTLPYIYII